MPDRKEYFRKYREEHKARLKELHRQTYECEICKKQVTKYNKAKHEKSIQHLQNKAHKKGLTPEEKEHLIKSYKKVIGGLSKQMKDQEKHLKFTESL